MRYEERHTERKCGKKNAKNELSEKIGREREKLRVYLEMKSDWNMKQIIKRSQEFTRKEKRVSWNKDKDNSIGGGIFTHEDKNIL